MGRGNTGSPVPLEWVLHMYVVKINQSFAGYITQGKKGRIIVIELLIIPMVIG